MLVANFSTNMMCGAKWTSSLLVLSALLSAGQAFKILLVTGFNPSHVLYFGNLGRQLVGRGHSVTLIRPGRMPVPDSLATSGIKFLQFQSLPQEEIDQMLAKMFHLAFDYSILKNLRVMKEINEKVAIEAENLLKDEAFFRDAEKEGYDFVIIDMATSHTVVPYRLGLPFATLGTDCPGWNMRSLDMPSFVPTIISGFSDKMDIFQRSVNALLYVAMSFYYHGGHDTVAKYAPNRPLVGYADIIANISLCLKLRESVVDFARATSPNVIDIGGMMAKNGPQLTDDYQTFMDESEEGVIFVSFGTLPFGFPAEFDKKLALAFSRLPQRVIWRATEGEHAVSSGRVKVVDWAPQVSILSHPNCVLFISHCGVNSLIEATYHAVPVLALPMAIDQKLNAAIVESKGYGIKMDIGEFTPEELVDNIERIFKGNYKETISLAAEVFRDLPAGGEKAVYWIEHVVRYGASHLIPAAVHMTWYQYLMVDVFLLFSLIFGTVLGGLWFGARLLRAVFSSSTKSKAD